MVLTRTRLMRREHARWLWLSMLAIAAPTVASAGSVAHRSHAYHVCVANSGGRDATYRACAADEAARAERALNATYARALKARSLVRRELRAAERRWVARRQHDCGARYRAELPGQEAGAIYQLCMADAAIARTATLSGR